MGIIRRQSILSSLIHYAGIIVGYLSVGYLFPKFLDPDEFGLTRIILSVATVAAVVARFGFKNVLIKYSPYYRDAGNKDTGLLLFSLLLPIISFCLVAVLLILIKPYIISHYSRSPLFIQYYYYVVPLTFFISYMALFEAYLKSFYDLFFVKLVREILIRVFIICSILLFAFNFLNFDSFVLAFVISYGLALVVTILYIKFKGRLHISYNPELFTFAKTKQILGYGYFIMLSGGASIVVSQIDTIMLGMLSGEEKVAVFTVAMYIGKVILVPQSTLNQLSGPRVAEFWKENKMAQIDKLYKRTSLLQVIFGLGIFCLIWANVDNIFRFVPDGKFYAQGKMVILFISLASVFDLSTSMNTQIISYSPFFKFTYRIMIFIIVLTIATNYYFIPIYGISGAAIATAITIFIHNLAKFLFIKIKFNMQPFTWPILFVMILCILAILSSYLLPYMGQKHLDLVVRSIIVFTIFSLPIYFFKISPDLNSTVKMMFGRFRF